MDMTGVEGWKVGQGFPESAPLHRQLAWFGGALLAACMVVELLPRTDGERYRAKPAARRPAARSLPEPTDTMLLERDLRLALELELEQFELMYQPIFDIKTGIPVAVEALVRWRHPARGLVPPSVFVPLAERLGLIEKLGRWVMHTACTEAATWATPVRLAINLSPAQFSRGDLEHQVIETLHRSGFASDRLDLEVTEGVLLEHSQPVLASILSLRTLGVRLALDEFGQPGASLGHLRDFAFQQIKIGRSFVASMLTDPGAMATVRRVLALAADMQLDVVALGVETQAQLDLLTHLGCAQVQGTLLGAPLSPERTREYLWQVIRRSDGGSVALGMD